MNNPIIRERNFSRGIRLFLTVLGFAFAVVTSKAALFAADAAPSQPILLLRSTRKRNWPRLSTLEP